MADKNYKAIPITARSKKSVGGCSSAPFKQTAPKAKEEKSMLNKAGHLALDLAGFIDVWGIGTGADLINAAWYTAEGDVTNAALSTAAAVPVAGWAAGASKLGLKGTKALKAIDKGEKALNKVTKNKVINNKIGRTLQLTKPLKLGKVDRVADQAMYGLGTEEDKNNAKK